MYLGKMVEIANYDQLYEKRYHPYTEALLSAIPQVDQEEQKERIHLEGEVPSPYDPPSGCHFHTRCPKACDKCRQTAPELKEVRRDIMWPAIYTNKFNSMIIAETADKQVGIT